MAILGYIFLGWLIAGFAFIMLSVINASIGVMSEDIKTKKRIKNDIYLDAQWELIDRICAEYSRCEEIRPLLEDLVKNRED